MRYLSFGMMCYLCFSCGADYDENLTLYEVDINLALETNWVLANEITDSLNKYRQGNTLEPFQIDSGYASAYAVEHNMYMINRGMISHDNYEYRVQALQSHGAKIVGEVVAYGYNDAQDVVQAWLNSHHHKQVIDSDYKFIGFGVTKNQNGVNFFTLLFYK